MRTTLDLDLQQTAEQAVTNGVVDLHRYNVNNAALLAADPKTGEVRAWVGSARLTPRHNPELGTPSPFLYWPSS